MGKEAKYQHFIQSKQLVAFSFLFLISSQFLLEFCLLSLSRSNCVYCSFYHCIVSIYLAVKLLVCFNKLTVTVTVISLKYTCTIPLKLSLLRGSRPKSASANPNNVLTVLQMSSKSVHFRRSYSRSRDHRFFAT